MNPALVIPTYWTNPDQTPGVGKRGEYDFATPLTKPLPELERCLSALDQVRGILRVIILLVVPPEFESSARARVEVMCRAHSNLNPLIVGSAEAQVVTRAFEPFATNLKGEVVGLRGLGAIKNLGLAVSAILGHDVVVFLDDEEVVDNPDFLVEALWGLGSYTRSNERVLIKTGSYIDERNQIFANPKTRWSEALWSKAEAYNQLMKSYAEKPTRICRAQHLTGGVAILHGEVFSRVPFDPYITRGEDLDYVMCARAWGFDVWYDKYLTVGFPGPRVQEYPVQLFCQDVYRWYYEKTKLAALNKHRELEAVPLADLEPYPAPWFSEGVAARIWHTAVRRMIVGPHRLDYLRILLKDVPQARAHSEHLADAYLTVARVWPLFVVEIWQNSALAEALVGVHA